MNIQEEIPDFSYLQMVSRGNQEFELVLIQSTIKSIGENILKLKEGISLSEPVTVKKAAHAMKPLFAIAGAKLLQQQCNELDQLQTEQQDINVFINRGQEIIERWKLYQMKLTAYFPSLDSSNF